MFYFLYQARYTKPGAIILSYNVTVIWCWMWKRQCKFTWIVIIQFFAITILSQPFLGHYNLGSFSLQHSCMWARHFLQLLLHRLDFTLFVIKYCEVCLMEWFYDIIAPHVKEWLQAAENAITTERTSGTWSAYDSKLINDFATTRYLVACQIF